MKYGSLPLDKLSAWAHLNNVTLNGISITSSVIDDGGKDKGGGVIATAAHEPGDFLLTIPSDLTLSSVQVDEHAKRDRCFREMLEALGPSFSRNSRKKTLVFLILQLTYCSPGYRDKGLGVSSPFTDYVRFLPKSIPLPTFFSDLDRELLEGTSLSHILAQKLDTLQEEFDQLQKATSSIPWCRDYWWDPENGILCLDDWKLADALYRSRSVGLPHDQGTAMVPVLDMANHGEGPNWNARFDMDGDGTILLVVADDKHIAPGEEVTIMYSHAGACEMLFSYGFIERDMIDARELFLFLEMSNDDPLTLAKTHFAQEAPGVRILHSDQQHIRWESPLVWWSCINEEDGLEFGVVQTNHGSRELEAKWKGVKLFPTDSLENVLMDDDKKDIFSLRANVLVQQVVELQGQKLIGSEELVSNAVTHKSTCNVTTIKKLRELETKTLGVAYQQLDAIKAHLSQSDTVRAFLSGKNSEHPESNGEIEDFS